MPLSSWVFSLVATLWFISYLCSFVNLYHSLHMIDLRPLLHTHIQFSILLFRFIHSCLLPLVVTQTNVAPPFLSSLRESIPSFTLHIFLTCYHNRIMCSFPLNPAITLKHTLKHLSHLPVLSNFIPSDTLHIFTSSQTVLTLLLPYNNFLVFNVHWIFKHVV